MSTATVVVLLSKHSCEELRNSTEQQANECLASTSHFARPLQWSKNEPRITCQQCFVSWRAACDTTRKPTVMTTLIRALRSGCGSRVVLERFSRTSRYRRIPCNTYGTWQAFIMAITLAIALGVLPTGPLPQDLPHPSSTAGNATTPQEPLQPPLGAAQTRNQTAAELELATPLQSGREFTSQSRCWICESSAALWTVQDGMDICAARFMQGCFALPW